MIRQCVQCSHKPHAQDKIHGQGNRVINDFFGGKDRKTKVERCTVCGHETVRYTGPAPKEEEAAAVPTLGKVEKSVKGKDKKPERVDRR